MRCFRSLWLSLLTAYALCGCGSLFYAQVEEPELCKITSADYPAALPMGTTSQNVPLDFDLQSELKSFNHSDLVTDFEFRYAQFDAKDGISDFSFVDSARISVQGSNDPSCNLPDLLTYQRDPSSRPQSSLILSSSTKVDLVPCFSAGKVTVQTSFTGRLPTNAWSMNLKVCFSGKAKIEYLKGK